MTPAPYPVLIIGLPRSMTFWTAQTLGYDHDQTRHGQPGTAPGLCDTGFALLPPEERKKYFGPETLFVHLRRPEAEVQASLLRHFPEANPDAIATALARTSAFLRRFLADRPHLSLPAPLTPQSLRILAAYLDRKSEFLDWADHLAHRRDVLDEDPALKASMATVFPFTL
jgi:hypothetical protein